MLMTTEQGREQGWLRLAGVRHPLLLEASLPPLAAPRQAVDTLAAALDDSTAEVSAQSAAGDLASRRGGRSGRAAPDDGPHGAKPRALDMRVPPGISVAAVTGPNTVRFSQVCSGRAPLPRRRFLKEKCIAEPLLVSLAHLLRPADAAAEHAPAEDNGQLA